MPGGWDEAKERKLLLSIIHNEAPKAPNWDQIAVLMGNEFTGNAIRQRFLKMKKAAATELGDVEGGGDGSPVKTPTKRSRPKKAEGEGSGKSTGKRSKAAVEEAQGDADDDDQSPSKKIKGEKVEEDEDCLT